MSKEKDNWISLTENIPDISYKNYVDKRVMNAWIFQVKKEGNKNHNALNDLLELYLKVDQYWLKSNKSDYALEETRLKLAKGVYEILVPIFPKEMGVKNK